MKKINKKLLSIIASICIVTVVAVSFVVTGFKSDASSNDSSKRTDTSHVISEKDYNIISNNEHKYPDFIEYDFGDYKGSDSVSIDTKVESNVKKNNILVDGKDSENIVIGILGDGFTKNEQDKFNESVKQTTNYLMSTEPYSQMKGKINIYSANINSKDSGVSYNPSDNRDTFFGTSFNHDGIQRRMKPKSYEQVKRVTNQIIGDCDATIILANDTRYGGSADLYHKLIIMSLTDNMNAVIVHELGHILGKLQDEYWSGAPSEGPNMTQDKDSPPWKDLIGKDGVGVYPYEENPSWYRPSNECAMIGNSEEFCPVCKRQLIKNMNEIISNKKK